MAKLVVRYYLERGGGRGGRFCYIICGNFFGINCKFYINNVESIICIN